MPFRYDEAVEEQRQRQIGFVKDAFKITDPNKRERALRFLNEIMDEYGPPVDHYPDWHPLRTTELAQGSFQDHLLTFRDAALFAPYTDCLKEMKEFTDEHELFLVEKKGELFHHENCKLYLVVAPSIFRCCEEDEKYIERKYAIEAMLNHWNTSFSYDGTHSEGDVSSFQCWESWETMHRHLLGSPCGKRSSLFVDEATGQAIRRLYAVIGQALGLKEYGRL